MQERNRFHINLCTHNEVWNYYLICYGTGSVIRAIGISFRFIKIHQHCTYLIVAIVEREFVVIVGHVLSRFML
ncbi:hypothetical protein D3C74_74680 [compost metagenome]